jgi:DNA-binding NtrC family response regulator
MLADYFVNKCIKKCHMRGKKLAPETLECLVNYDWPGNVRELENAIERALVLSLSDVIQPEDLPESILEKGLGPNSEGANYHNQVKALKKQLILNALEETKRNYTEAARLLGVHVNYLHRLIRNLDLKEALHSSSGLRPGSEHSRRSSRQLET